MIATSRFPPRSTLRICRSVVQLENRRRSNQERTRCQRQPNLDPAGQAVSARASSSPGAGQRRGDPPGQSLPTPPRPHGPGPAVSLVGSYELLVWLIRAFGSADREPSAEHLYTGAACRATARPRSAPAIDGERLRGSKRGTSDPTWRPAGQAAGQSPVPATGHRDQEPIGTLHGYSTSTAVLHFALEGGTVPGWH